MGPSMDSLRPVIGWFWKFSSKANFGFLLCTCNCMDTDWISLFECVACLIHLQRSFAIECRVTTQNLVDCTVIIADLEGGHALRVSPSLLGQKSEKMAFH